MATDHGSAVMLQQLFHTSRFRVYTSEDVTGIEAAGALKNVYAIAVGIGDGLGAGDNTRAMVITRSLREMMRLGVAMGGREETARELEELVAKRLERGDLEAKTLRGYYP